ncbi:MAG: acyltransferase family protein [Rhodospirillaceae bacterium]
MRSSTGYYSERLDHLRGLAAFLVFMWHFLHQTGVPYAYVPSFAPLSLLEEGHIGVALFMVLSGYLFQRLCAGHDVSWRHFYANRVLRLAPLMICVWIFYGVADHRQELAAYAQVLIRGFITKDWPGGGWSITAEMHFYLLFPLLFAFSRSSIRPLLAVLIAAIVLRAGLYASTGEVQTSAYWTIIGRIDQFLLGMVFARVSINRWLLAGGFVLFVVAVHAFNLQGGYYDAPSYPSPRPYWIIWPTIEGLGFACLISLYERAPIKIASRLSKPLRLAGETSYSIYLLHFIYIRYVPFDRMLAQLGVPATPGALYAAGFAAFVLMLPIAWLSYQLIEKPPLRLRMPYIRGHQVDHGAVNTSLSPPELQSSRAR